MTERIRTIVRTNTRRTAKPAVTETALPLLPQIKSNFSASYQWGREVDMRLSGWSRSRQAVV
jgi:outer membrane receptor for Fe3+-dicitrate